MGSFILEIQNDTMVTPIQHFTEAETNNGTARAAFYQTCAVACVSQVERHTVIWMDEEGHVNKRETFTHGAQA